MNNLLTEYRKFYWMYEAFLLNVESTFKNGFQTNERIQKLCHDYREKKGYNITHRAKNELLRLEIQEGIKFSLVLNNVRKDISKLHLSIDAIIKTNNLNHVDIMPFYDCFFWTVNWFWQFEKWFNETFPCDVNTGKEKTGLTLRQIALKYLYEGKLITRENGDSIAKQYGQNSGEKLFQHYTHYSATPNRVGKPSPLTRKKLENKINLFQSVVDLLPEHKRQRAIDELKTLRNHYSNEIE